MYKRIRNRLLFVAIETRRGPKPKCVPQVANVLWYTSPFTKWRLTIALNEQLASEFPWSTEIKNAKLSPVLHEMKVRHRHILRVTSNVNIFTLSIFFCTFRGSGVRKVGLHQTRAWQSFKVNQHLSDSTAGSAFKVWESEHLSFGADCSLIVNLPDNFLHPSCS